MGCSSYCGESGSTRNLSGRGNTLKNSLPILKIISRGVTRRHMENWDLRPIPL